MPPGGWMTDVSIGWLTAGVLTVVKITVLLLLAAGVVRLLRARSAALRHTVWTAALVAALALPALEAGFPDRVRVPAAGLPAAWTQGDASATASSTAAGGTAPEGDALRTSRGATEDGAPTGRGARPPTDRREVGSGATGVPASGVEGPSPRARAGARGNPGPAGGGDGRRSETTPDRAGGLAPGGWLGTAGWIALLIWAAGAVFVLARTTAAGLRLGRIRRRSDRLADPEWSRRVRTLWKEMGGASRPPVRVSPEISVPLTCGVVRPALLLPQEALDEWRRGRTEAVLFHELAHLRRRDTVTHVLARLACAVYWFHPGVWRAARAAAKERERACDDAVLRAGVKASEYARYLLETARQADPGAVPGAVAVSVARRSDLEGRVLSVLERDTDRRPVSRNSAAGAVLPVLGLTLALAAIAADTGSARPTAPGGVTADTVSATAPEARSAAERPDVVPALVDLLDDADPAVRSAAAEAVGRMKIGSAVAPLIDALKDPSPEVRREAAGALARIEDLSAVEALRRVLVSDPSRGVRKAAAWALGETESAAAVDALEEALDDADDRWVEKRIARALGETRRPSAVPVLRRLVETGDRKLRRAALTGLVENGTDRAVKALEAALESDDPELRAMAARALGGRE